MKLKSTGKKAKKNLISQLFDIFTIKDPTYYQLKQQELSEGSEFFPPETIEIYPHHFEEVNYEISITHKHGS